MPKILILGARGNLGPALIKVHEEHEVLAWDTSELDITERDMVIKKILEVQPAVLYNCAAYNAVDKAESEPEIANLINGTAVGYIAEACNAVSATLVHFSTNYVFTGTATKGYTEDAVPDATSKYGQSKILGEQIAQRIAKKYYIIRTSLLYGKTNGGKKSFNDIALELAAKRDVVTLVNDEIGHPTYVNDLAEAAKKLVDDSLPYGIYHITNSGHASWYDWGKEIYDIKRLSVDLQPIPGSTFPRPAPRPKFGVLLNTKFRPLRPWQEALRDYFTS
jgi:dTDP-4-dehydrorhamnose reductase